MAGSTSVCGTRLAPRRKINNCISSAPRLAPDPLPSTLQLQTLNPHLYQIWTAIVFNLGGELRQNGQFRQACLAQELPAALSAFRLSARSPLQGAVLGFPGD